MFEEYIHIAPLTSMKIGGVARYGKVATTVNDVISSLSFCKENGIPLVVLGKGTNSIFDDALHTIFLLRLSPQESYIRDGRVFADAGCIWDDVVSMSVGGGLMGIEKLSGIPGTAGAAPIQNIGAYGQEISEVLEWVQCIDTLTMKEVVLNNRDCMFSYRSSIFKTNPGRFIILKMALLLKKGNTSIPTYKDVVKYFGTNKTPTVKEMRSAVLSIRSKKLPDPSVIPNCGSFFKNPFMKKSDGEKYGIPSRQKNEDEMVKVSAGYLVEKCGLKGAHFGPIQVYPSHALILTNKDKTASFDDLKKAYTTIIKEIKNEFNSTLEIEPVIFLSQTKT